MKLTLPSTTVAALLATLMPASASLAQSHAGGDIGDPKRGQQAQVAKDVDPPSQPRWLNDGPGANGRAPFYPSG